MKSKELAAVDAAIAKTNQFFCRHCWNYRSTKGMALRGKRKVCKECQGRIRLALQNSHAKEAKTP